MAFAVAAGASLLAAASAAGAVTIGSDLAPDPVQAPSGAGTGERTIATVALPGAQIASPIDGVVVRWRVRAAGTDPGGNDVRLKVIRPQPAGTYTGVSTSATQTISTTTPATSTFETAQAVRAGDLIGLDISAPNGNFLVQTAIQTGVHLASWQPLPLLDGQTRAPDNDPFGFDYGEHTFNADVEPDLDCDGLGDETQDPLVSPTCGPPPPSAELTFELRSAKRKALKRLSVKASCGDDACEARVAGKVVVRDGGAKQRFGLRRRTAALDAAEIRRIGLRVEGAGARAELKDALESGARATAKITGAARAEDGRLAEAKARIRLRRP